MPHTPIKAFQWDLARQIERLEVLKKLLPRYAAWGYQELYLHLEDAVHYPSLPGVGRPDAYTYDELGELVLTAAQCGIRVVPIVNLLGHTQYLIKHPEWRDLNELRDEKGGPLEHGQLCPLHSRTAELAGRLLRDMAPCCTAGKVHVGLDESFLLGRCPQCREEIGRLGLGGHFAGYVSRLHRLCASLNLGLGMWSDMLYFTPEAIPLLPAGITAYDWYYYPFARKPRVEFFNFAERDLAPALKRRGIRYYGCPMNGAFRYEPLPVFGDRLGNIRSWWQRCANLRAEGFLITSWEANRLALETTTVVDAAAAGLWLEPETDDATAMLAGGLARVYPRLRAARPLARALLAADEHAFSGYARWQINERWDLFAGDESLKSLLTADQFFARLLAGDTAWPRPWTCSLAFRLYLARRDLFVRAAARAVFKLRRLLRAGQSAEAARLVDHLAAAARQFAAELARGRQAARQMWGLSREAGIKGPNATMVAADRGRLDVWRAWLKRTARDLELAWRPTPVCGAWQLQFMVHNFAPAVQKVVVLRQSDDGSWSEIAGRYTIEFRAQAARPHSKIKREFTVPINSAADRLRIVVRGVGQVAISHVTLTDGVEQRRRAGFRRKTILGKRAPRHGLPVPDWTGEAGLEIAPS